MTLCCWRIFFPGGLPFGPLRRPGCGTCCSRCHCLGHLDADSERMGVHQRIRSSSGLMSLFVGQSPAFGKSAGIFGVFLGWFCLGLEANLRWWWVTTVAGSLLMKVETRQSEVFVPCLGEWVKGLIDFHCMVLIFCVGIENPM